MNREQVLAAYGAVMARAGAAQQPAAQQAAALQELARQDLFFLLVYLLGRADVNRDWLFARCNEVQDSPDGHLDLWAREHFKSSIITFGKTIQDILNDPEVTVGIFSHTRPIAKDFLRQIMRELERNQALKALFPAILYGDPRRDSPKWSVESGIVVRRRGNPKEATVEAWGLVDGQPTGKHFQIRVYDDVVTRGSVTTPAMARKVTSAWELSLNLGAEGGRARTIGTRYHFNDSYAEMMRRDAVKPRLHPATLDGTVAGAPVLMSRATLAAKRRAMGPYTFGCQMLLNPTADATQGFKAEWLRTWPARQTAGLNLYILVDPASGKRRDKGDYTAIWVLGLGEDLTVRGVTMIRDRLSLTERADALFALHRQHRPLLVGYEDYGLQADIAHMKARMARENYLFEIRPLKGRLAKEDRIRRLVPWFEQGRIRLPETCWRVNREGVNENLTQVFIDEEYRAFPVAAHDDLLDALSRIEDPDFPMKPPGAKRHGRPQPPRANNHYQPHRW